MAQTAQKPKIGLPPDALARAANLTSVPSEVIYGRELARSSHFRDPNPSLNSGVILDSEEYLVYFINTRDDDKNPSPIFNCLFITNQRIIQVTKGAIVNECSLGDIESVSHHERGMLRWDDIVITRHSDKAQVHFGVYKNATAKFFFEFLKHLEGPKGVSSDQRGAGKFLGKTALVTGSTKGIGLAAAKRLLAEGARVVICSRKVDSVQAIVQQLQSQGYGNRVLGRACNVGQEKDIEALVDFIQNETKGEGLDVVVCNAAVSPPLPSMLDTPRASLSKLLDTNLTSVHHLVTLLYSKSLIRAQGSVVIISSIGGFHPNPPHPAYGVSKTALFGLTKALATELGRDEKKIRVNCIAPGMIKTGFSKPIWQNPSVESTIAGMTALGRLGNPEEIAACVSFLGSSDASYVTGEVLVAAGGMNSRL